MGYRERGGVDEQTVLVVSRLKCRFRFEKVGFINSVDTKRKRSVRIHAQVLPNLKKKLSVHL